MDKITIERETLNAAMMALEYLLEASPVMTTKHRDAYSTAARLRAALAAQPAEPVAWRWKERVNGMSDSDWTVTNVEPPDGVRVIAKEPLYAAQPAPAAVPLGWKLVPLEPTPEMCKIGGHVMSEWTDDSAPLRERTYAVAFADAYRAMIAAAGDKP